MSAPNAAEVLNLVGFVTGTVLYAMLLSLVLRGRIDHLRLSTERHAAQLREEEMLKLTAEAELGAPMIQLTALLRGCSAPTESSRL